ncbi:MAG TPA: DUF1820 family protein [Leucothrix sp.]|nr:DUF1820 family protein [Desulfobacterales bacterium]HIP81908.1 DUF1820 family protein [Leucothrix mucor]HIQ13948.1 DUF1820 family protein [Leucothrix sp.]
MNESRLYKVSFINQDKVYEVFAKQVYESDLYGFLAIEEIVFGSQSEVVVDPSEEKLKAEFDLVKRSFIPFHSVIRIDEVKKQGVSKIKNYEGGNNIAAFPPSSKGDAKK